jgi:hypothetical protein
MTSLVLKLTEMHTLTILGLFLDVRPGPILALASWSMPPYIAATILDQYWSILLQYWTNIFYLDSILDQYTGQLFFATIGQE